jgi:hypothetical protein
MRARALLKGRLFLDVDNYGSDVILIKNYTSERKGKCVCGSVNPFCPEKVYVYPDAQIKKVLV